MAKKILIAEDSASVRKFVTLALKLDNFEVLQAIDGMEALEKLANNDIDLLITDLNMPNIDGLKLIEEVRNDPLYLKMPIIVLSSLSNDEDIDKALKSGANSYLIKPFNTKKIQYEVAKYLD